MTFPEIHPEPLVRAEADQSEVTTIPGNVIRFLAPGSWSGGEFGLFEGRTAPGRVGAIAHYHKTFAETFYVLSGVFTVLAGDDWRTARSGDVVHVPRDGIHAFRNDGTEEVRYLILFTPGIAREGYFADLAARYERDTPPTPAEIDAMARRHDQFNLR